MFNYLAFGNIGLAPNKTLVIYYQLVNYLVVAFQSQLHFYVGKLWKYHQHKLTNHRQQFSNHLCKANTRLVLI